MAKNPSSQITPQMIERAILLIQNEWGHDRAKVLEWLGDDEYWAENYPELAKKEKP